MCPALEHTMNSEVCLPFAWICFFAIAFPSAGFSDEDIDRSRQSSNDQQSLTDGDKLAEKVYGVLMSEVEGRRGKKFPPEEVEAWRRDWLDQLLDVLRQTEDSGWQRTIANTALGMANGVGDFKESERLLVLLADISEKPEQSAEYLAELGGLRERAQSASGQESGDPEAAQRTYDQAIAKLLQIEPGSEIAPAGFNRLIRTMMDVGVFVVDRAKSLKGETASEKYGQAMAYFKQGRDSFATLRKIARERGSANEEVDERHVSPRDYQKILDELLQARIDDQEFAARELTAAAAVEDDDRAIGILKFFEGINNPRISLADHVLEYASLAYGPKTEGYCAFLKRWISETPISYDQLKVRTTLATMYNLNKQFPEANEIARPVFDDGEASRILGDREATAFAQKKGGLMADAMVISAQAQQAMGDKVETVNIAKRFLKLFGNDDRADYIRTLLTVDSTADRDVPRTSSRFLLIGFNVVIISGLILVGLLRKKVPASTE